MVLTLVDKNLRELIENKQILSSINLDLLDYIQPASLDIPLSDKAYLIKDKILPFDKKISDIIEKNSILEIDLNEPSCFLKGQTYLVKCLNLNLPKNYCATISPKSSIGRIDLMTRAIFDNSGLYDTIPENKKGELWLEITPQSFNVKVKKGISLSQIRIFKKENKENSNLNLEDENLVFDLKKNPIKNNLHNNKLILNLNLKDDFFGYVAVQTSEVIDLTKINYLDYNKFFRKIKADEFEKYTLEKDKFYIVATNQAVRIPKDFSAEMVPFTHLLGELRVHYAGFFDPGFGEEKEAVGVLEIRPYENITVYNGQPICFMKYFKNLEIPQNPYGKYQNNYLKQKGPKLSKYFKKLE